MRLAFRPARRRRSRSMPPGQQYAVQRPDQVSWILDERIKVLLVPVASRYDV
jgi:hypothetical protein